jgi:DNA-binding transcriptional ArsR family regulator
MKEARSMRDLERALKAAGDPTRTRILKLLEAGPLCVCQVQAVLGLAPSTVSKHLAILKGAALVEDRKQGRWIRYQLAAGPADEPAAGVLALLRGAIDRDAAVVADRRRLREVRAVPLAELCRAPSPLRAATAPPPRRAPAERRRTRRV